ncbi:hypothetical protein FRC03_012102 [Tulasnella sp. 419]|nr:hypothetical protein FRC03_012102 [Tulasnella sp. 419]
MFPPILHFSVPLISDEGLRHNTPEYEERDIQGRYTVLQATSTMNTILIHTQSTQTTIPSVFALSTAMSMASPYITFPQLSKKNPYPNTAHLPTSFGSINLAVTHWSDIHPSS